MNIIEKFWNKSKYLNVYFVYITQNLLYHITMRKPCSSTHELTCKDRRRKYINMMNIVNIIRKPKLPLSEISHFGEHLNLLYLYYKNLLKSSSKINKICIYYTLFVQINCGFEFYVHFEYSNRLEAKNKYFNWKKSKKIIVPKLIKLNCRIM